MRFGHFLAMLTCSFFMFSCTDEGGKLTEIDLVVRDANSDERLSNVSVQLMQGRINIWSSFENSASIILFKTDARGLLNKFYFSNESTNTRLVVGVLPDTMSSCYPRINLEEGEKNTIHYRALPRTARLRIDFSAYNQRTNFEPIDLNIVHTPDVLERLCDATVFADTLTPSAFPILDRKIYAFGEYRIRGRTLQDPWESFEVIVKPDQQDAVVEVVIE